MQTVVKKKLNEEVESMLYSQKYMIIEYIALSASTSERWSQSDSFFWEAKVAADTLKD